MPKASTPTAHVRTIQSCQFPACSVAHAFAAVEAVREGVWFGSKLPGSVCCASSHNVLCSCAATFVFSNACLKEQRSFVSCTIDADEYCESNALREEARHAKLTDRV